MEVPLGILKNNSCLKDMFTGTLSVWCFKESQAGGQDLGSRHTSEDGPFMHSGLHFSNGKTGV